MPENLKIGGVPEHFNLPILLGIESGYFANAGLALDWTYYPGGTGAMTAALTSGELDLAILLTEGYVAAVSNGLRARVVKTYIESPLVWGIYTGAASSTQSVYDRSPKKYAISRIGSGSHLMAMIHAEQRGQLLTADDFVIVNSLESAIESLSKGETQVFYWEKMMTKKYVTYGEVRLIGEFSAPWSGFLIVAGVEALVQNREAIIDTMSAINEVSIQFLNSGGAREALQERFAMSEEDVQNWLSATVWNTDNSLRRQGLQNAIDALHRINTSAKDVEMPMLYDSSMVLI